MVKPRTSYVKNTFHFVACFSAVWMIGSMSAYAQVLDLSQNKHEHLITQNLGGETGDVLIYVSFPNWFGQPGYCPVRVRVVPRKGLAFKYAGQLKVIFSTKFYTPSASERQVIVDIPIESGASEATGEVLGNFLFDHQGRFSYSSTIFAKLNGRKLTGQQMQVYNSGGGAAVAAGGVNIASGYRNLVLISKESAEQDGRRLEALAEMAETKNWFSQEVPTDYVLRSGVYCDVRNMPTNWLCLSGLQNISIGFDDLKRMDAQGLECLNNYVLGGGYLIVNNVPDAQAVANLLPEDAVLIAQSVAHRRQLHRGHRIEETGR